MANGYQWYFNNALIPGAISQSYYPTQNGNYSVVIMDANGCTGSSTDYPFYMTGVQGTAEMNGLVYPNPVKDELVVQTSNFKVQSVEVFDIVGKKCFAPTFSKGVEVQIDVSALDEGIYFVLVKSEKGFVIKKFIKQKE